MKKITSLKFLILFLMLSLGSCYKQKKYGDNFEDRLSDNFYVFKGTLDEEQSVVLAIYIDGKKLSGYYFLDSTGVNHSLKGTINEEQFVLEEKSSDGKLKSVFTARLHDKERFKGEFLNHETMKKSLFKAKLQEYTEDSKTAYIAQLNVFQESTYSPRITVPKVVLGDTRVAEIINNKLNFKSVTGYSKEEVQAEVAKSEEHHGMIHGILSSDFAQKYNRENILCLRVSNQYLTHNHSTVVKFYTFDLKTGDMILGKDLLNPFTTKDLIELCDSLLKDNINRKIKEIGIEEYNKNYHLFRNHKFDIQHLDNFFIEESTIVFFYDFDFPREKQDLMPTPELAFSFEKIKKYLNKKGPLRFMFEELEYKKRKRGAN